MKTWPGIILPQQLHYGVVFSSFSFLQRCTLKLKTFKQSNMRHTLLTTALDISAVAWAKLAAVWQNLMTTFNYKTSPPRGYDLLNKPINFGRSRCCLRSLSLKLSYMWTAEWRIIWRKIIAVIYAIFAVAKRKPEKKKSVRFVQPVRFLFATAKLAYITAMIFLH